MLAALQGFSKKKTSDELRKKLSTPGVVAEEISQLMKEFLQSES